MVPYTIAIEWIQLAAEYDKAYRELYVSDNEQFQIYKKRYWDGMYFLLANQVCAYCGAPAVTFDHIVAKFKGGETVPSNLNFACKSCNSTKHTKSLWEFFEHCQKHYRAAKRKNEPIEIWLKRIHNISGLLLGETWPDQE